jgi:hypothetical protein
MYYPEPTPKDKTGVALDSVLSATLTMFLLEDPDLLLQLGEYWLHGYFDTTWE